MSILKKLAGETVIYGLSHMGGRLLGYLLVPFHTRMLQEQADFGIHGEFYAYVALLMVIFTYRMETGFFRFGRKEENRGSAFSTATILLLCTTPVLVAALVFNREALISLLSLPNHPEWIVYLAFVLGLDALAAVPKARLRLDSRPMRFAFISLTNILTNVFFNVFFLWICPMLLENGHTWVSTFFNPDDLVGYIFISNLIASAVTFLLVLPYYFSQPLQFDKALFRRLVPYALPLIVVGFAGIINEVIDRALLVWLLPGTPEENRAVSGIYNAAYKLAMMMTIFIQAFNYAAEPFFFRNADRKDSRVLYGRVGQAFSLVGSFIFIGLLLYMDIVQYFLGDNFREGLDVVPILLMANLFLGLYYNFAIWFKLSDRTTVGMYIAIGGAVITLVMNALLIPTIGYQGSAWTTLTCYFFMSVTAYLLGQRYYPIDYPIKRMLLYVVLALGGYGVSVFVANLVDIQIVKLLLNTVILLTFVGIIYKIEKDGLIRLFQKGETV